MTQKDVVTKKKFDPVILWLASLCGLIILMVGVGGITRLTGSGLSIVDWKPIMGAIPPLTTDEWLAVFQRYQLTPQFKLINHGMNLADFKLIYFWEYFHRLLGRGIGVIFLLPWLFFITTKKVQGKLSGRLLIGFGLGGLQGALGWFMVKSGLIDQPHVSHFRLAAHLSLALLVLGYLFWIMLDLIESHSKSPLSPLASGRLPGRLKILFKGFTGLVGLQIIYGALTAGLKAGFGYNTFPKMMDHWLPPEAWMSGPLLTTLLTNHAMVQFIHRSLGWGVLASAIYLFFMARNEARFLLVAVLVQFILGVFTLVLAVPITLAVLHQIWACVLLLACLRMNHKVARRDHLFFIS